LKRKGKRRGRGGRGGKVTALPFFLLEGRRRGGRRKGRGVVECPHFTAFYFIMERKKGGKGPFSLLSFRREKGWEGVGPLLPLSSLHGRREGREKGGAGQPFIQ